MKRSEINRRIGEARDFFAERRFLLPPLASWSPQRWQEVGREADEIRQAGLGWDITDFGGGEFEKMGLTLFTIRNGVPGLARSKTYCEKIMLVGEDQVTPMHFHFSKTEDIINRGGGNLGMRTFWADEREQLNQGRPVEVSTDGVVRRVEPGEVMVLAPGESVTIPPRLYHTFWALQDTGAVMAGEVSTVNDDKADNRFLLPLGRFPKIEEDEPAKYLLCGEYP